MSAEYIMIGNMQFRPMSFADMEKETFITFYAGKLQGVDILVAWDIIQDHIAGRETKEDKTTLHNKRKEVKVKKK